MLAQAILGALKVGLETHPRIGNVSVITPYTGLMVHGKYFNAT